MRVRVRVRVCVYVRMRVRVHVHVRVRVRVRVCIYMQAIMRSMPDDQLLYASTLADPTAHPSTRPIHPPVLPHLHTLYPHTSHANLASTSTDASGSTHGILRSQNTLFREDEPHWLSSEASPLKVAARSPMPSPSRRSLSPRRRTTEYRSPSTSVGRGGEGRGGMASGGEGSDVQDHFNTSESPFASSSPEKQRSNAQRSSANGAAASVVEGGARVVSLSLAKSRVQERSGSNSPHGAARAVAEAVSSISQWRPRYICTYTMHAGRHTFTYSSHMCTQVRTGTCTRTYIYITYSCDALYCSIQYV